MKGLTLNNSSKRYLDDKAKQNKPSYSKNGKVRFDLAEGLWEKNKLASLPDRSSLKTKKAIGKFLNVKSSQISVFAGADEILEIIPRIYLNPKETAVVVTPTFERIIATNLKVGAEMVYFPLKEFNNFRLNDESLGDLLTMIRKNQAKIVWLCSPNNPTGQVTNKKYIEKIAARFPHVLLVVDEAYQEYFSLSPKQSSLSLLDKCNNIIIIRSFSKAFGLAGIRIGYAIGNEIEIAKLESYRTMFNVSTIAQNMATKSVSVTEIKKIKNTIFHVVTEREKLIAQIKKLENYKLVDNSQTNFLLLKHHTKDLFEELYSKGIVTSDWRSAPGVDGLGYIRISVNRPSLNSKLVSALKEIN